MVAEQHAELTEKSNQNHNHKEHIELYSCSVSRTSIYYDSHQIAVQEANSAKLLRLTIHEKITAQQHAELHIKS